MRSSNNNSTGASRNTLLDWVNELTGLNVKDVGECRTGLPFLMIVNAFHPQLVPLNRVTFNPQFEHHSLHNFKILQEVLDCIRLRHSLDIKKLIKGSKPEIMQLLNTFRVQFSALPCTAAAPRSPAAAAHSPSQSPSFATASGISPHAAASGSPSAGHMAVRSSSPTPTLATLLPPSSSILSAGPPTGSSYVGHPAGHLLGSVSPAPSSSGSSPVRLDYICAPNAAECGDGNIVRYNFHFPSSAEIPPTAAPVPTIETSPIDPLLVGTPAAAFKFFHASKQNMPAAAPYTGASAMTPLQQQQQQPQQRGPYAVDPASVFRSYTPNKTAPTAAEPKGTLQAFMSGGMPIAFEAPPSMNGRTASTKSNVRSSSKDTDYHATVKQRAMNAPQQQQRAGVDTRRRSVSNESGSSHTNTKRSATPSSRPPSRLSADIDIIPPNPPVLSGQQNTNKVFASSSASFRSRSVPSIDGLPVAPSTRHPSLRSNSTSRAVSPSPYVPVHLRTTTEKSMGRLANGASLCNLSVCVRARPPLITEKKPILWTVEGNTLVYHPSVNNGYEREQAHPFNHVFSEMSTTEEIYAEVCRTAVRSVVDGINSSIFAYGATCSGKTYTIGGKPGTPGIIELASADLFVHLQKAALDAGDQNGPVAPRFSIVVSYLECYNEVLSDLLNDSAPVTIHDDPARPGSVICENLTRKSVHSVEEIIALQRKGEMGRHVDANNRHAHASRSHTIFRIHVEWTDLMHANGPQVTRSVLNIVDLAGSESNYGHAYGESNDVGDYYDPLSKAPPKFGPPSPRTAKRKMDVERRNKEGSNIRCSLLALIRVVRLLAEKFTSGDSEMHIPYRDSKLTRLMADSVGGNTQTVLICTVTPTEQKETLATLHFAQVAQQIRGTPKPTNIGVAPNIAVDRYREELRQLSAKLEAEKKEKEALAAREREKDQALQSLQTRLAEVKPQHDSDVRELKRQLEAKESEIAKHAAAVAEVSQRFEHVHRQLRQTEEERVVEMEDMNRRCEEAQFEAQRRVHEAKQELDQKSAEASTTNQELSELRKALELAEKEATEAHREWLQSNETLDAERERLRAENEALTSEKENAFQRAKVAEQELNSVLRERDAMQQYIAYKKGKEGFRTLRKVFGKSTRQPWEQPWDRFMIGSSSRCPVGEIERNSKASVNSSSFMSSSSFASTSNNTNTNTSATSAAAAKPCRVPTTSTSGSATSTAAAKKNTFTTQTTGASAKTRAVVTSTPASGSSSAFHAPAALPARMPTTSSAPPAAAINTPHLETEVLMLDTPSTLSAISTTSRQDDSLDSSLDSVLLTNMDDISDAGRARKVHPLVPPIWIKTEEGTIKF